MPPTSHLSVSKLVDEAVRLLMREDQEDLAAVSKRAAEPEVSYEYLLNDLRKISCQRFSYRPKYRM